MESADREHVSQAGGTPAVATLLRHQIAPTEGKRGCELRRSNSTHVGSGCLQQAVSQAIANPPDAVRPTNGFEEHGRGRDEQGIPRRVANPHECLDGRSGCGQ